MRTFVLTLDCDWAPDFVLEDVLGRVERAGARATVFATHASPALARPRRGVELGWHPNFLPGSSQGADVAAVAAYLRAAAPGAACMRAHDLFHSTSLLRRFLAAAPEIRVDSSLYVPGQDGLAGFDLPVGGARKLRRYPIAWEDDLHLDGGGDGAFRLQDLDAGGACVLDFHPIHVWLNSRDGGAYARAKALGPLAERTEAELRPLRQSGEGIGAIFDRALRELDLSLTLSDLAARDGGRDGGRDAAAASGGAAG